MRLGRATANLDRNASTRRTNDLPIQQLPMFLFGEEHQAGGPRFRPGLFWGALHFVLMLMAHYTISRRYSGWPRAAGGALPRSLTLLWRGKAWLCLFFSGSASAGEQRECRFPAVLQILTVKPKGKHTPPYSPPVTTDPEE